MDRQHRTFSARLQRSESVAVCARRRRQRPAYQLWISAAGRLPKANVVVERVNPWEGFRIGAIGNLEAK